MEALLSKAAISLGKLAPDCNRAVGGECTVVVTVEIIGLDSASVRVASLAHTGCNFALM